MNKTQLCAIQFSGVLLLQPYLAWCDMIELVHLLHIFLSFSQLSSVKLP